MRCTFHKNILSSSDRTFACWPLRVRKRNRAMFKKKSIFHFSDFFLYKIDFNLDKIDFNLDKIDFNLDKIEKTSRSQP